MENSTELHSKYDTVYLSLGSNLGDRKKQILTALEKLIALMDNAEVEVSPLYETEAWGKTDQLDFLNCVAKITFVRKQTESLIGTDGANAHLEQLLRDIHHIEELSGRNHSAEKWSARTIDIDILLYNDLIYESSNLTIPHSKMHERNFVLIPLADLAPDLQVPGHNYSVNTLLSNCDDDLRVSLYTPNHVRKSNRSPIRINT